MEPSIIVSSETISIYMDLGDKFLTLKELDPLSTLDVMCHIMLYVIMY